MIIEPELKKKTELSRGINARHYSIGNEREISIITETKEQSLFGIVSFPKKKKLIPTNGRIFLNNDIPFYAQEKFVITNGIIIKIIN